jgi:hypothetical protein
LPADETKSDLPLPQMLAQHRANPACASCHARFDSFGLAFEGYGPVGERRSSDLAGRLIKAVAEFPGGGEGVDRGTSPRRCLAGAGGARLNPERDVGAKERRVRPAPPARV